MKLAFLGDSITLGYGLSDRSARFSTLVSRALDAEEVNLGITGTLVARAGLSSSDGTAFVDRVGQIAGADCAVIFGGTNDYFWSDSPIVNPGGSPDLRYFADAAAFLADTAASLVPRVLFVTPYEHHGIGNFAGGEHFRHSSEHDTTAVNYVGHTIRQYAEVLRETAEARGLETLTLHEECFDWRALTSDGCHPNEDGHRWLAERILGRLR